MMDIMCMFFYGRYSPPDYVRVSDYCLSPNAQCISGREQISFDIMPKSALY